MRHEEFITICKEKDRYEMMKDNSRSEKEKIIKYFVPLKKYIFFGKI